MNATVAVVGNPTSNKGKGAEVGKQVVELLQEAGRKHGFNVIDVTGESFDDSLGQFTRNYTQTTKRGLLTTNKG